MSQHFHDRYSTLRAPEYSLVNLAATDLDCFAQAATQRRCEQPITRRRRGRQGNIISSTSAGVSRVPILLTPTHTPTTYSIYQFASARAEAVRGSCTDSLYSPPLHPLPHSSV